MHVCVYAHKRVCMSTGSRGPPWVPSGVVLHFILRQGLSLHLELTNSAPRPPQHWLPAGTPRSSFSEDARDQNHLLSLEQKTLYWLHCFPSCGGIERAPLTRVFECLVTREWRYWRCGLVGGNVMGGGLGGGPVSPTTSSCGPSTMMTREQPSQL